MTMLKHLLIFCLFISLNSLGQTMRCDTIHVIFNEEFAPKYKSGPFALMDYFVKELLPIIVEESNDDIITSASVKFTINSEGRVIDIVNQKGNYSDLLKTSLLTKLSTMESWTPGVKDGNTVCSEYSLVISCLNYE